MRGLTLRDAGFLAAGQAGAATDPSFANVSLLLHCEGADNSTALVDSSPRPKTITAFNGAKITTSISKYGSASLLFDGIDDYVKTDTSSDFNLSGDFTIEYWVRQTSNTDNGVHVNVWESDSNKLVLASIAGDGIYYLLNSVVRIATTAAAFPLNVWHHIALCRNGATTTLYINGSSVGTTTSTPLSSSKFVELGQDQGRAVFVGQLDEIRITNNVARYTSNFTPPTAPFPDA